jgi:hypothetical protein
LETASNEVPGEAPEAAGAASAGGLPKTLKHPTSTGGNWFGRFARKAAAAAAEAASAVAENTSAENTSAENTSAEDSGAEATRTVSVTAD